MPSWAKIWKDEATDESYVPVSWSAGYFEGCTVNYDTGAPPASFAIQVLQG